VDLPSEIRVLLERVSALADRVESVEADISDVAATVDDLHARAGRTEDSLAELEREMDRLAA
jgi:phage shock protein A